MAYSQDLESKTDSELNIMLQEAIVTEDYRLAGLIKEEIDNREKESDELSALKLELDKAVENEEYEKAAELKEEIKKIEEKRAVIAILEEEMQKALEAEDYATAGIIKEKIEFLNNDQLEGENNAVNSSIDEKAYLKSNNGQYEEPTNEEVSTQQNYGLDRLSFALLNYSGFNDSDEVFDGGISRISGTYQRVDARSGFSLMAEVLVSVGFMSDEYISYWDLVGGFGGGLYYGFGGSFNFYLSTSIGATNTAGEISYRGYGFSESTDISGWGFYYNAAAGFDVMFSDNFGLTCQVGVSPIPMLTVGVVW